MLSVDGEFLMRILQREISSIVLSEAAKVSQLSLVGVISSNIYEREPPFA